MDQRQLSAATAAAAERLAMRGIGARAEQGALRCAFPGGLRAILRNHLATDPDFNQELLLDTLASTLVSALR